MFVHLHGLAPSNRCFMKVGQIASIINSWVPARTCFSPQHCRLMCAGMNKAEKPLCLLASVFQWPYKVQLALTQFLHTKGDTMPLPTWDHEVYLHHIPSRKVYLGMCSFLRWQNWPRAKRANSVPSLSPVSREYTSKFYTKYGWSLNSVIFF